MSEFRQTVHFKQIYCNSNYYFIRAELGGLLADAKTTCRVNGNSQFSGSTQRTVG